MADHSIRGYLSRRSTKELEAMLNYYLQKDRYKSYGDVILMILDILAERFKPDITAEEYAKLKEKLLSAKL